ncbi:UNVERIFIED_CONTAM: hypothetical protein GTU68_042249, partial [Idotea baltica]|nr:hypothetical protein [Idotea baltica]
RLTGDAYFDLLDEFVAAVKKRWPKAIIQWEDFAKDTAFAVLERYRKQIPSFNDDIQGTGAVVLAGLLNACKLKGETLSQQRIVVVGAGAGGVGVSKVIQDGLVHEGLTREQARSQMFIVDEFGLVIEGISQDEYKKPIMQSPANCEGWETKCEIPSLLEVIHNVKPTAILGLTGVSGLFTERVIQAVAEYNKKPIIFPLSNPTSNVEAIPEDIFNWCSMINTGADAYPIIASGSPFPNGQGNNAFIFPGLGFACSLGECKEITESLIIESAHALADYTSKHHLEDGRIYPPIAELQSVSQDITERVMKLMLDQGLVRNKEITFENYIEKIAENSWKAEYLPFVAADKNES